VCVVVATTPMDRLQIRPIVHNSRAPYYSPKLYPGWRSSVGMRRRTGTLNIRAGTQTAVADIHFAPAVPRAKCSCSSRLIYKVSSLRKAPTNESH